MRTGVLSRKGKTRVELLCVGTELLTGKTNAHGPYFSRLLEERGLPLARETTLSDDPTDLRDAFAEAWKRSRVVITTGGLGPTFDDVTRDVWARVLGRPLRFVPALLVDIREKFRRLRRPMPLQNRRQALVLRGADVIPNPLGTAPGLWLEKDGRVLVLLPGPARELRPMAESVVLPRLSERFAPGRRETRVWRLFGLSESAVDASLTAWLSRRAKTPGELWGILAQQYVVDIKLTLDARCPDFETTFDRTNRALAQLFGDKIFGTGDDTLARRVERDLRLRGERLCVVESCTGGLLAQKLTVLPGASDCFWGGWVTYDNRAKIRLGVPATLIQQKGAVSRATAASMAEAGRRVSGADWSLAITGVAGPGGGTKKKPVGLVFVALSGASGTRVWRWMLSGEREGIQAKAALTALDALRKTMKKTTFLGRTSRARK